jgi:hypothetical protein
MITAIIISFTIATIITLFWVDGVDKMNQNHPDYKGEDFLDWDEKDHNDIF